MLVDGSGANGLAFVYDQANEQDSLDGVVARSFAHGVRAIGKSNWVQTLRVALRSHGSDPWTAKDNKEHTDELLGLLHQRGIKAAIVMQSPATPGVRQVHSAWNILGHSGNPYKWAGTAERRCDLYVCPVLHPVNYEYVYGWLIERWIRQAYGLATGELKPLPVQPLCIEPLHVMLQAFRRIRARKLPLSVDIETNMAGTIITAIGLSDGQDTISMPWHGYAIANQEGKRERGLKTYIAGKALAREVPELLADESVPKILHNGAFDVLQLAKHGISLAAFQFDTLLMHRVVYPQFRHGLQQACATEFCVEPWKALYKPPKVSASADPWLGDPQALRAYNARDTFCTWQLWQHLEKKLG